MNYTIVTLFIYLLVAGNATFFLGQHLYKNGYYFLVSIFNNREEIIQPVNKLLLVGFYLVNIGFVLLYLSQNNNITDLRSSIEFLSQKIGVVFLVVAIMHFFNILVFILIESYTKTKQI